MNRAEVGIKLQVATISCLLRWCDDLPARMHNSPFTLPEICAIYGYYNDIELFVFV